MEDFFLEQVGSGGQHLSALVQFARALTATGRGGGCVDFMAKLAAPERLENAERNAHARMRGLFGNEISPYPVTFTVAGESGKPSREDIYCFAPYEVFAELHRHPDQWKLFTLRESPPAHPKTATLSKCSEYRELGASCRPRGAIIGPS